MAVEVAGARAVGAIGSQPSLLPSPRPYPPPPHKTRNGGASPTSPQQPSPGKVSPLSASSSPNSYPRPLPWVQGPPLSGWGGRYRSWW